MQNRQCGLRQFPGEFVLYDGRFDLLESEVGREDPLIPEIKPESDKPNRG